MTATLGPSLITRPTCGRHSQIVPARFGTAFLPNSKMGAERRGALTKTTRIKNSPVLDSEESHEAAAESKVEKEERAILHRFLQADGKNAQDNADDGPTHEEYADFLQLVAPDQTRLDEFRRTRNV